MGLEPTTTGITIRGHNPMPARLAADSWGYLLKKVEQDHRNVKFRAKVMLGFKRFRNAAITIAGIELMHRVRKGQFALRRLGVHGRAAPAVWNSVLAA